MERGGFRDSRPAGRQPQSNRPVVRFQQGYPVYLDKGCLRVELVTTVAQQLADDFRAEGKLTRHQLRAFYDHAKRQLQRLDYGATFPCVLPELARLKAFAADRALRGDNALPQSFKEFIDRNVDAVKDETTFRKGFMPHFEALVAYCADLKESR